MKARCVTRILLVATLLVAVGAVAATVVEPRAMDFAGEQTVALAAYRGPSPTGVPVDFGAGDRIARGKYLAQAGDCEACHTAAGGPPFAGSVAFNLPFGTIYSPNITSDRQTGIGSWTDAQYLRAVREGIGPKAHLYPVMPYASYAYMTDEDALAIRAYLKSFPPVRLQRPPVSFSFPLSERRLMWLWSALYKPTGPFRPNADRSPAWNRGAYLAEALGHCGDCHTPRNFVQGLVERRKYSGTITSGWRAFNLTGDRSTGIGGWSDAELARYLSQGHTPGRGTAAGPMGQIVDLSLSELTASDINAIITYLRTIPAISTADQPEPRQDPAPSRHRLASADAAAPKGKKIFEGACVSCHAWSGKGSLNALATLNGSRAVNDPAATNVAQVVISGASRRTAHGQSMMPAFGSAYSNAEIAAVANYVTARFGVKASKITASEVAQLRKADDSPAFAP